jgi:UPF0176 protein
MTETPLTVAALYQFAPFADCAALRAPLQALCDEQGIKGTLLLAPEGINGTVTGTDDAIARLLEHIRALPGCAGLDVKFSTAPAMPFHRMKVRIKREIVTMGQPDIDPLASVGTYVEPQDWNALIADPDTIVIDTRNDYEVAVGTFAGAIDPHTRSFSEFPAWFREQREALLGAGKPPRVAMFCTGGIRCEKSTAFLKAEGWKRSITSRAASSTIWKRCPRPTACGRANASSSTSASPSATVWRRAAICCATPAAARSRRPTPPRRSMRKA